ncbi:MAG: sensor histidine kinase [Deferribacterales bacterium]
MLNSIPFCTAILSPDYKLVFCNEQLIKKLGIGTVHEVLAERPGNFFKCVNTAGGLKCGTTNKCHECSLNKFMSQYSKEEVTSVECRIINVVNETIGTLELKVHLSPTKINNNDYIMMMLENINIIKRNEMLNRTFLHDVLNTACGLTSMTDYFGLTDQQEDLGDFASLLKRQTMYLIEEIKAHKELIYGQSDSAADIIRSYCLSEDILRCAMDVIKHFAALNSVHILINHEKQENSLLYTDPTLIRRVLVNLFKNAVESADENETIEAGCRIIDDKAVFYIKNKRAMDEETKSSLFNRIFSTKETGSGLGTFSIKLLTEKYLEGTVNFSSDEASGTIFYVSLPTANPAQAVDDIIESKGRTLS